MNIAHFIADLRRLGIELWVDGERLRYKAPKGVLTSTLRAELTDHKLEVLAFLHTHDIASSGTPPPLRPIPRDGALPLSFAQERMWFLEQLMPGSPAYNTPVAMRITGPLNIAALEQSVNALMQRHEILRTTYVTVDEQPVQVIAPTMTQRVPVEELQDLPAEEREGVAGRRTIEEARRPFDLLRGSLLRVHVLRLAAEEHILLLTTHHLAADGWSIRLLMRELGVFYAAYLTGNTLQLPALPFQYADFAHWQRQWLQHGEIFASQLAYWKKQLTGVPGVLALPTDRARPAVETFRGATQTFVLPVALSEAIRNLSRREGATVFMTLLVAFQTLLHRYTQQPDIVVATAVSNRSRLETEDIIGPFANDLLLRTDCAGDPTFRDLLHRVREVVLDAYAHQDMPFEKLVEALQPERDLSRNPLFQMMFLLHQGDPVREAKFPGCVMHALQIDMGTSRFDMTLEVVDEEETLLGTLEYNTDLFNAATIARMLGHWQTVLERVVTNPDLHLGALSLLTAAERQQMLVTWNATHVEVSQELLPQLVDAQATLAPEAVAMVCGGQQLTYGSLNAQANQLAHFLQQLGVGPDVLVGICVERSVEMLVGLFGILKAGGAYVPLDPTYPQERLAFMLQETQVPVLLTQERLRGELPVSSAKVICLDSDWPTIAQKSETTPVCEATPAHLAYVLYTSGSTGTPKGVQIPHRALSNFLHAMRQEPGVTAQDTLLAVTTLAFDIAALELFLPLTVGARVVLARRDEAIDGLQLQALLTHSGATVMQATPATWRLLLEAGWQGNPTLKLLCGGEALSPDLAASLLARGASLWNLYGPTETTIWSAVAKVEVTDRVISIGRPIANTQLYILDTYRQPVSIGVAGELYIGGAGLARDYLRRPTLTAERFVPDPFRDGPGMRLYRTGDLARYLPDGTIELLGRLDHQVKIRGFRIELGEIEVVLSQHPAVWAAVVVRQDAPDNPRLVAYVVPNQEPWPASSELRNFLQQKLPHYMVPATFVWLETLPLTSNGKVDRQALPAPEPNRAGGERAYVAPRTRMEEVLTDIWQQVLGVKQVGVHDNFFDLGGHSLLAVRLFAHIEKACSKKLPLITLFQAGTIEALARIIQGQTAAKPRSALVEIQPHGSRRPIFFPHLLGGDVFYGRNFSRYLGPDQPVYGFQALDGEGEQEPFTQIEDMAAHYVKELRTVQPKGPYCLAGYCSAGIIAYEMARLLYEQGEQIALLAMIDPGPFRSKAKSIMSIPRSACCFLQNLPYWCMDDFLQVSPSELWIRVRRRARAMKQKIYRIVRPTDRSSAEVHIEDIYGAADLAPQGNHALMQQHLQILMNYVPRPYPGRITFFRARAQDLFFFQTADLGWRELAAGGVDVKIIPGNHATMMQEPHIRLVRAQLRAALDEAQHL